MLYEVITQDHTLSALKSLVYKLLILDCEFLIYEFFDLRKVFVGREHLLEIVCKA